MITVNRVCVDASPDEKASYGYFRFYTNEYIEETGVKRRQTRSYCYEIDYANIIEYRDSDDNGRTWGPWIQTEREDYSVKYGTDEMVHYYSREIYNPVHNHYVKGHGTRYCMGTHTQADQATCGGKKSYFDHQGIMIRRKGEEKPYADDQICYEAGDLFDPENTRNLMFLERNLGDCVSQPVVLANGDVAFTVCPTMEKGCDLAGVDVNHVFPSCPEIMPCVMIARGRFNSETEKYDFTFSNPILISDLESSRGFCEPTLAELKNGRLIVIMRGSNVQQGGWRTRIEKGTPSFKWYAWSDDGGRTFTDAMPWHFNDGEVIYSSSSISHLIRSGKNGKLYWIGNITSHEAYGNLPRFPLHIVQVDDETGMAVKESLTVIDTKKEGESEQLELSNFSFLEDRESGRIEVDLFKREQYDYKANHMLPRENWHYDIDLGE